MNISADSIENKFSGTTPSVSFIDLNKQNQDILSEWINNARNLINQNRFIQGPEVSDFENAFAAYNATSGCVGVASGTDALFLALKACGIGKDHEVITVSHSFIATAEAISMTGAKPVFIDIGEDTFTMDVSQLGTSITDKTRAIVPVHLYGQCVDMDPILEFAAKYNLFVIEDACQAHGAMYKQQRAGSIGHLGCFSFYPTKNLGAFGDGGAVISNDRELLTKVRQLADHGQVSRYHHTRIGFNSRLDSLQAAALSIKLRHLDHWNDQRNQLARLYDKLLNDVVQTPQIAPHNRPVYHLYVIQTNHRDALKLYLKEKGIDTMIHYPVPIHGQPAYGPPLDPDSASKLTVTNSVVSRILSLPLYPGMSPQELIYIAGQIRTFFNKAN